MGLNTRLRAVWAVGLSGLIDRALEERSYSVSGRRRGWFGVFLAVVWLVWLVPPIVRRWSSGEQGDAALAALFLFGFAALIVGSFLMFRRTGPRDLMADQPIDQRIWVVLALLVGLHVALVATLGGAALPTALYVAVVAIFHLPLRESGYVVLAVMVGLLLVPVLAPRSQLADVPFYLAFIPVGIWLARQLGLRGEQLAELNRRQRAELELVEERNRVARDVHDILGHSLTVITVKTELAQRLLDVDLGRARTEMADIERLAREALAGVRETVGGLREVSLRGELANARTALAAADIVAELPDEVPDPAHGELFGWVLREAVTNVIRHSAARHCTVRVSATSIEVVDDGRGLDAVTGSGSGLTGLRERVRAAGGTLTLTTPEGGGLRVCASVPG
ncbi:sensor histidine kinase [Nocardia brasiliensis]|uniref:sensor histidine kinase n=1 Tax=Nocardia brasiliensis TaxID=37326 RepID=UPI001896219A|nr:sensor histidine kinase [Nocardia brasiliensis]MBF6547639.1 sensor histidine kinase [Nocardia brasiliensis]